MHDILQLICDQYLTEKEKPFGNNSLAQSIRKAAPQIISHSVDLDSNKYLVHGSAGQGHWALIPWIAVFDREITLSATHGYYIVYLFSSDMQNIYLSLNQGWTFYKNKYGLQKGLKEVQLESNVLRNNLNLSKSKLKQSVISLAISQTNSLAMGYEAAHITGTCYKKGKIPNNEKLRSDLLEMIGLYKLLKEQKNNLYKNIYLSSLPKEKNLVSLKKETENNDNDKIKKLTQETLHQSKEPPKTSKKKDSQEKRVRKIDPESNPQIGKCGEDSVLEFERKRLTDLGRPDLAKRIEHVSSSNDSAGYDIKSFDIDIDNMSSIKDKYIEVKTTTTNNQDGFYISANELEFAKQNKDNYYIYRVYSLKRRLCHNKQLINSHFYRGVSELPYKLLFAVIYTHLEFRYEVSHTITSHHVHHFHQTRIPDGTLLDYMVQYRKPLFPQFFLYPKKFLPENNPHHKEFHLRPYIQNNANQ